MSQFASENEYLGYFMLNIFHRRIFENDSASREVLETEYKKFASSYSFPGVEAPIVDRLVKHHFISLRKNSKVKVNKVVLHTFRNEIMQIMERYQKTARAEKRENVIFEEYKDGNAELLPGSAIVKVKPFRDSVLEDDNSSSESETDETDESSDDSDDSSSESETDDSTNSDHSNMLPVSCYPDNFIIKCQLCKDYELVRFDISGKTKSSVEIHNICVKRMVRTNVKSVSVLERILPTGLRDGLSFVIKCNVFETSWYGEIKIKISYKKDNQTEILHEDYFITELELLKPFHCFSVEPFKRTNFEEHYPCRNVELYCTPGNSKKITWVRVFQDFLTVKRKVTPSNCCVVFQYLLEMEDIKNINLYKRYSQTNVQVQRDLNAEKLLPKNWKTHIYKFELMSSRRKYFAALDELTPGDHMIFMNLMTSHTLEKVYSLTTGIEIMKNQELYKNDKKVKLIFARIEDITERGIEFHLKEATEFDLSISYTVHFVPQRETYLIQYMALKSLKSDSHLMGLLFPSGKSEDKDVAGLKLDLYNKTIYSNPEQYEGVKRIATKKNSTIPYIIFGPPGTGKTTTLVEAVLQLWKANKENFILITGGSNACCDEIGVRLTKTFMDIDRYGRCLLRLYSKAARKKYLYKGTQSLNPLLKAMSNICRRVHMYPPPLYLGTYKIIVSTIGVIGRYANVLAKPFTHVFIDECGASTEPEVVSALSGLISKKTVVILSGDPKQLGPVVKSEEARALGSEISTLERIMKSPCYKYNSSSGHYDRTVQIRLVRNFRTHPKILHLSNEMYYDGQLKYKADKKITHRAEGYYELPVPDFPIIFHSVDGICSQRPDGTSFFNDDEVNTVVKYVKELLFFGINGHQVKENDIGVISPYKYQVSLIKEKLQDLNWRQVEVGSVEVFQGQEKPIIVFSTVRSGGRNIGFVASYKRINVSLTRAQSLLIIVGNHNTLKENKGFNYIVEYCTKNRALKTPFLNEEIKTKELSVEKFKALFIDDEFY